MSQSEEISNWEIFLWALDELGGSHRFVDVEDVFVRCYELSPNRFSWRTRVNIPDYKKCSKALRDAEAKRPPFLIKTGNRYSRQLTVEGERWLRGNQLRLSSFQREGKVLDEPKSRPQTRALVELEQSEAFTKWRANGFLPSEKWKMADIFLCSQDSPTAVWRSRLEVLRSAANRAQKGTVLAFLDELSRQYPNWFGTEECKD